jgi:hypothetical protein
VTSKKKMKRGEDGKAVLLERNASGAQHLHHFREM